MTRPITRGSRQALVTGASGFVGRYLCEEMLHHKWLVKGAARSPSQLPDGAEIVAAGNIDDVTDWMNALRGVDVIIHLAARVHVMKETAADPLAEFIKVNLHGTENLARQAARAGVKRLVFVSSIGVNGYLTEEEQVFSEKDSPQPHNAYAISKWRAEQALWEIAQKTGLEVVVVRPPLIYGPEAKGNFLSLLAAIDKGIPLPLKEANNLRSLVYVGNLVDALIACATHPAAAGQTYLVSDGEDISTSDLLRQLGAAMGSQVHLLPCPTFLLKLAGRLTGKSNQVERLLGSLRVDSGKIRRELNWTPPYTMQQGLQAVADWYRAMHT